MQQRFSYIHETITTSFIQLKFSCNYVMGDQQKSSRLHLNLQEYNIKGLSRANTKNETIKQPRDVKIGLIHR